MLDPVIKQVCSRIYESDRVKYHRLIQWVKTMQSKLYTDKQIADTLILFEPYAANVDNHWWAYLHKLLTKVYTMAKQGESGQHKTISKVELDQVGDVLRKIMGL